MRLLEFSNLASELVVDVPIKIAVINRGNQRVFGHDFGCIQGGNLVATGCNGNSGVIGANFGLKNGKMDNFQQLGPVGMPIQCCPNFSWL